MCAVDTPPGKNISIHALREEGDRLNFCWLFMLSYFYPRPPRGGRPVLLPVPPLSAGFLSTPSARRATCHADNCRLVNAISIHALREEGDKLRSATLSSRSVFLSTPSARRATTTTLPICQEVFYFYPRPPRGGRLDYKFKHCNSDCISIHALREEGDSTSMLFAAAFFLFLSTPSARRATCFTMLFIQNNLNFYPRPPRGGRRDRSNARRHQAVFLSTPSARRATREPGIAVEVLEFLSTPSARRATREPGIAVEVLEFLSTPSARRATR